MNRFVSDPLSVIAIAGAAMAAAILVWFLLRGPALVRTTKIVLLFGMGVFPLATASTGNVVAVERSTRREFCASCHVMLPWTDDAANPHSTSLASIHSRNAWFGEEPCYSCHADYGMYKAVKAKMSGMRHVYEYVVRYHAVSADQAVKSIRIHRPYPNANCIQCHSTRAPGWKSVPDHQSMIAELRAGRVSCVGSGCHGPVHPFADHHVEAAP
jgi:nitrate/TMAO reductase-like tetraheme cytochrome c subunit